MSRLAGKVAIVTGGASGIGAATACAFVEEGGSVVIADRSAQLGIALAEQLGDAAAFQLLDVTNEGQWLAAVQVAESTYGRLNVLVNGAGIGTAHTLEGHSRELWDLTLAVNLTGPFLGLTSCLGALKRAQPSSVINISSLAGLNGVAPQHAYTASKHGVTGLTKSAARELAPLGIRVNSVHPGGIATPMLGDSANEVPTSGISTLGRLGRPDEIARMITWLASDESSFCNGSQFVADGGYSAGITIPPQYIPGADTEGGRLSQSLGPNI